MGRSAEVAWVPDCSWARLTAETSGIARITVQSFERKSPIAPLWHNNRISRLQHDVLGGVLTIDYVFVVERVLHLLPVFHAQEIYVFWVGELCKSSSAGKRL